MIVEELKQRWSVIRDGLSPQDVDSYRSLFSLHEKSQVRSTFDLLLSLDESGLCELLCEVGGQLRVQASVNSPLLWERCVLEEVTREGSQWHEVYIEGYFSCLEIEVCGEMPWIDLTSEQQKKVVAFSLRNIHVQVGSFMMGHYPMTIRQMIMRSLVIRSP